MGPQGTEETAQQPPQVSSFSFTYESPNSLSLSVIGFSESTANPAAATFTAVYVVLSVRRVTHTHLPLTHSSQANDSISCPFSLCVPFRTLLLDAKALPLLLLSSLPSLSPLLANASALNMVNSPSAHLTPVHAVQLASEQDGQLCSLTDTPHTQLHLSLSHTLSLCLSLCLSFSTPLHLCFSLTHTHIVSLVIREGLTNESGHRIPATRGYLV